MASKKVAKRPVSKIWGQIFFKDCPLQHLGRFSGSLSSQAANLPKGALKCWNASKGFWSAAPRKKYVCCPALKQLKQLNKKCFCLGLFELFHCVFVTKRKTTESTATQNNGSMNVHPLPVMAFPGLRKNITCHLSNPCSLLAQLLPELPISLQAVILYKHI